jgi:hypothetical protein
MKTGLASALDPVVSAATHPEPAEHSTGWIQPSVINLTLGGGRIPVTGDLIDGVYLVPEALDDDEDEMAGLVAAYDEAKSHRSDIVTLDEAIAELEQKRKKA